MKILQVGLTDSMGKRFNGTVLHRELLKLGVKSEQCLWDKNSNDSHAWQLRPKINITIKSILKNLEYSLSIQSLLYPYSWSLFYNKRFKAADLVHYHLIYPNFFSLLSLPLLTYVKPSIWTLHDPWPLTGHCIHPFNCKKWKSGCGRCPNLNTLLVMHRDNTALMWKIKKAIYRYTNLEIIVASNWMLDIVKESPLLLRHNIHKIPFGINLDTFKPWVTSEDKQRLGIDPKTIVIAFRASLIDFKGFQYIKLALDKLNTKRRISLLSFDNRGLLDQFRSKYQVINLGWVDDEKKLVQAFRACDIFLMPSTAEAFGMMAVEAMACAKPVIVFSNTALAETVFAPKGGIAVPYKDSSALAFMLNKLIINYRLRKKIGENARKLVEENYNLNNYVRSHIDLYKKTILKRRYSQY